jgi:uncharacterized protein
VLLDANALFLPFTHHVPLAAEISRWVEHPEIAVPGSVVAELERLVSQGVAHAHSALSLARGYPTVLTTGRGDTAIVRLAKERTAVVVTADRELRDRLVRQGTTVLSPRDRARLERHPGHRRPRAPAPPEATVKNGAELQRPRRPARRK